MEIVTGSVFVRYECSVVGRGGSRTALTGAVIMEQAGSTVGAGSKPARCDNDYILLILGGFGTHPYEVGYLGSPFSNSEREAQLSIINCQLTKSCPVQHTRENLPLLCSPSGGSASYNSLPGYGVSYPGYPRTYSRPPPLYRP